MASDDEEDLLALRAAALATMKKKPTEVEDVQPIPQLTSSSHSMNSAKPAWAEGDFNYDDHLPFQDHEPLAPPFPPPSAPPRPQFSQPPPAQFAPNNWPGSGRGVMGPAPRGPRGGNFKRFPRGGRGPFQINQGPHFRGQNQRLPFGQRMPFLPNQRPPPQFCLTQHRLPFCANQPQRPLFGQNPIPFAVGHPQVGGSGGGGGNLIVINTMPEGGEQPPGFPVQRPPFLFGVNFPPRGRSGSPIGWGGRGGGDGRGGGRGGGGGGGGGPGGGGPGGGIPPLVESPTKPMLLRPQDKYCPSEGPSAVAAESSKGPVHRKRKDKFSRYNSSDDESDDEESEEESEDQLPPRRRSVGSREMEEKEIVGSEDRKEDQTLQNQSDKSIPDAELSIVAMNSSQLDSDQEHAEPELDEPVIDSLGEPVIDNLGESVINNQGEGENVSEPELNEEEENRLLESPSSGRSSDKDGTPVRDESPLQDELPVRDESPVREASPEGSATPLRDESFDNEADATPVRDESPERDLSSEQMESPVESPEKEDPEQDRSVQSKGEDQSSESSSDSGSESGDESDSGSGTSSSGSSSGNGGASKSSSNSGSEVSETKKADESPSDKDSDSDVQVADMASDSESEEDRTIQRLPSKRRHSTNSRSKRSPSPPKPKVVLTPEEQARLEARRRKFESGQEVKLSGSTRTISLKGITSGRKSSKDTKRQNSRTVNNSRTDESSTRTVQTKTSMTKSNDVDFHCKHSRRKVSIEKPVLAKLDSNSEAENKSRSEEDEEDGGSRAWMREANTISSRRKTVVNRPLPDSGSYRGYPYRGSNRNGGYYGRGRESLKDSRPEVHYSSSDNDDQDSDRKLISVVVPRSAAGTHHGNNHSRRDMARSVVPDRKRTSEFARFDRDTDRPSHPKSKRLQDFNPGSDRSGSINVVISGERSSTKVSQSSEGRLSVHQRLGKSKSKKQHTESSRSRPTSRPAAKNQSDSASEGFAPRLFMRNGRRQNSADYAGKIVYYTAKMKEMEVNWISGFASSRKRTRQSCGDRRKSSRIVSCMGRASSRGWCRVTATHSSNTAAAAFDFAYR